MRFMKTLTAVLVASMATVALAAPAFAETSQAAKPADHAVHAGHAVQADGGGAHGKHGKKFPMPGAEFKAQIDQKIAAARQHLETRISSLPADKQKEARDKFNAGVTAVNAEVARAVADNVVTKDEATKVRDLAKQLRGHGAHGGHARKGGAAKSEKKP